MYHCHVQKGEFHVADEVLRETEVSMHIILLTRTLIYSVAMKLNYFGNEGYSQQEEDN